MRTYLRRLFLRIAICLESSDGEQMEDGFDGVPSADETDAMTPRAIARLLAGVKDQSSSAYIILSHELNMKIAKEQSKATLNAGWLGAGATLVAVFLSAGLGYFIGSSQSEKPNHGVEQPDPARVRSKGASIEIKHNCSPLSRD